MNARPLLVLAALAAATSPDLGAGSFASLQDDVRRRFGADPMGSVVTSVVVSAYLFYRAEVGHNPKVTTFYDALVFVTTSLSVGYSDIFARTPAGKVIASALMTFGPAMAASVFDPPRRQADEGAGVAAQGHAELVARLDRLIAAVEAQGKGAPSVSA
jgi:hypothetical protein